MKRLTLMVLLGASLAGCAGDPVKLQQNHTYVLEWIGERPLIDNSHLTVTLDGHTLTFGGVGSTRKACAPALMEQEQRFFKALQTVERWDISPIEQVRFWPAQGKPLRLWPEEG